MATVPLGAIFVMLAGSSTSRPHESVNMTVSAAGSSAGSSAGASVAAGSSVAAGAGSAGAGSAAPHAARLNSITSARSRASVFFMDILLLLYSLVRIFRVK